MIDNDSHHKIHNNEKNSLPRVEQVLCVLSVYVSTVH